MLQNSLADSFSGGDILATYRQRIWTLFGTVCVLVFLPGAVLIFFTGYRSLAALVGVMLVSLLLNRIATQKGKFVVPAMISFVASLMALVGLAVVQRGMVGVFWTFPAVLMITFLAHGKWAKVYTFTFFAILSAVIAGTLEGPDAARAITALGVSILVTNIFLEAIDKLQRRLAEQSAVDPLTGALNRREMDSILQDAIERKRRTNTPASLLVLDIDEFKSVNDTYGHAVGDHVLKEVAAVIMRRGRHLDKLFRLGGEEFMVFLPDTPMDGGLQLAEELRYMIASTEFLDHRCITVSIGITELGHRESIDEWLKRGDDALYAAKQGGRNQTVEAPHKAASHGAIFPSAASDHLIETLQ